MKLKYEELEVWDLSKDLISDIYLLSEKIPRKEEFVLTSQIKRAVISVALNISEGSVRGSKKEFVRFIRISIGSLIETDACIKIAISLGYLNEQEIVIARQLIEKIYFKLIALEKSMKTNDSNISNDSSEDI